MPAPENTASDPSTSRGLASERSTSRALGSPSPVGATPTPLTRPSRRHNACARCRNAKLKCISNPTSSSCTRCIERGEPCRYSSKVDQLAMQLETKEQLMQLSRAVQHMMDQLVKSGAIAPLSTPLPHQTISPRGSPDAQAKSMQRSRRKRKRGRVNGDSESANGADESVVMEQDSVRGVEDHNSTEESHPVISNDLYVDIAGLLGGEVRRSQLALTGATTSGSGRSFGTEFLALNEQSPMVTQSTHPMDHSASSGAFPAVSNLPTVPNQSGSFWTVPPTVGSTSRLPSDGGNGLQTPASSLLPSTSAGNLDDFMGLGADDPRSSILKRGLISELDAARLVRFFHDHLPVCYFGFPLVLRTYPYLPEGPRTLTPFILAVQCLVASEGLPSCHHLHPALSFEVTRLLADSPGESAFTTKDQYHAMTTINHADDEDLDRELGIGPEEIVACCVLAMSMTDRKKAQAVASLAFRWCRGWIKWTTSVESLPPIFGEICGVLPGIREPTPQDMARTWLLCYIVDGLAMLEVGHLTLQHQPDNCCEMLRPTDGNSAVRQDDLHLVNAARIIATLAKWTMRRTQLTHESLVTNTTSPLQRLAATTNASLEWLRTDMDIVVEEPRRKIQVELLWLCASMVVNAAAVQDVAGNLRLQNASWAYTSDAASTIIQKALEWMAKDRDCPLPVNHLFIISKASQTLLSGVLENRIPTYTMPDTILNLRQLAPILRGSTCPGEHPSRQIGQQLWAYADAIEGHIAREEQG